MPPPSGRLTCFACPCEVSIASYKQSDRTISVRLVPNLNTDSLADRKRKRLICFFPREVNHNLCVPAFHHIPRNCVHEGIVITIVTRAHGLWAVSPDDSHSAYLFRPNELVSALSSEAPEVETAAGRIFAAG